MFHSSPVDVHEESSGRDEVSENSPSSNTICDIRLMEIMARNKREGHSHILLLFLGTTGDWELWCITQGKVLISLHWQQLCKHRFQSNQQKQQSLMFYSYYMQFWKADKYAKVDWYHTSNLAWPGSSNASYFSHFYFWNSCSTTMARLILYTSEPCCLTRSSAVFMSNSDQCFQKPNTLNTR